MGFPVPLTVPFEAMVNTLNELIKSKVIAQKVVYVLHLDQKKPIQESNPFKRAWRKFREQSRALMSNAWQFLKYGRVIEGDPFATAVEDVQENLTVKPSKKSYVFYLEATAKDPKLAADIVNVAAEVFVNFLKNENITEAKTGKSELEQLLKVKEREVEDARRTLQDYKEQHKVTSLSEETSLQLKTVADLQETLEKDLNDLKATEQKLVELRRQFASQKEFVKYTSVTSDNPQVQELQSELSRLKVQRSALLEKFTPQHQEVQMVDAKIEEVETRIRGKAEKIVSAESFRLNTVYEKLLGDLATTEADYYALQARSQARAAAVNQKRMELKQSPEKEAKVKEMVLALEIAENSYKTISNAYEEARAIEAKQKSEIKILHQASVPSFPVRPIKIYYVGFTALMSLLLGCAIALLLEFLDTSVHSVKQLEEELKLPVLGTIPKQYGSGRN
jgi:uncharacterized protein involved in exopolysaccharide biosynthesis